MSATQSKGAPFDEEEDEFKPTVPRKKVQDEPVQEMEEKEAFNPYEIPPGATATDIFLAYLSQASPSFVNIVDWTKVDGMDYKKFQKIIMDAAPVLAIYKSMSVPLTLPDFDMVEELKNWSGNDLKEASIRQQSKQQILVSHETLVPILTGYKEFQIQTCAESDGKTTKFAKYLIYKMGEVLALDDTFRPYSERDARDFCAKISSDAGTNIHYIEVDDATRYLVYMAVAEQRIDIKDGKIKTTIVTNNQRTLVQPIHTGQKDMDAAIAAAVRVVKTILAKNTILVTNGEKSDVNIWNQLLYIYEQFDVDLLTAEEAALLIKGCSMFDKYIKAKKAGELPLPWTPTGERAWNAWVDYVTKKDVNAMNAITGVTPVPGSLVDICERQASEIRNTNGLRHLHMKNSDAGPLSYTPKPYTTLGKWHKAIATFQSWMLDAEHVEKDETGASEEDVDNYRAVLNSLGVDVWGIKNYHMRAAIERHWEVADKRKDVRLHDRVPSAVEGFSLMDMTKMPEKYGLNRIIMDDVFLTVTDPTSGNAIVADDNTLKLNFILQGGYECGITKQYLWKKSDYIWEEAAAWPNWSQFLKVYEVFPIAGGNDHSPEYFLMFRKRKVETLQKSLSRLNSFIKLKVKIMATLNVIRNELTNMGLRMPLVKVTSQQHQEVIRHPDGKTLLVGQRFSLQKTALVVDTEKQKDYKNLSFDDDRVDPDPVRDDGIDEGELVRAPKKEVVRNKDVNNNNYTGPKTKSDKLAVKAWKAKPFQGEVSKSPPPVNKEEKKIEQKAQIPTKDGGVGRKKANMP